MMKQQEKNPAILWSLARMEETGGAPDVIEVTDNSFVFADVSWESPVDHRNLYYDDAVKMAKKMGVQMMDEATWRKLNVDHKTQSWLLTDTGRRQAGYGLVGSHAGPHTIVDMGLLGFRHPPMGWRGVLKVPK